MALEFRRENSNSNSNPSQNSVKKSNCRCFNPVPEPWERDILILLFNQLSNGVQIVQIRPELAEIDTKKNRAASTISKTSAIERYRSETMKNKNFSNFQPRKVFYAPKRS